MACGVLDTAFADALLEDSWTKDDGSSCGGLEAIAQFNASTSTHHGNTVDPQMLSSNPPTPRRNHNAFGYSASASNTRLNDPLGQEPAAYENHAAANVDASAPPYYRSVEPNPAPAYNPSPLHHQQFLHRRSVSEPAAEMIFHRQDHYLGKPMHHPRSKMLKSIPKHHQRSHPYYPPQRPSAKTHPHPQALVGSLRPAISGSHAEPIHHHMPATSSPVPHLAMSPPHFIPYPTMPPEQPMYSPAPGSTTRTCTPAPEVPSVIDPALVSQPATPTTAPPPTVLIPVSVDELRAMIFDTVQKAVVAGREAARDTRSEDVGPPPKASKVQMAEVPDEDVMKVE